MCVSLRILLVMADAYVHLLLRFQRHSTTLYLRPTLWHVSALSLSTGIGLALTRHLLKNTNLNVINTTSSSNTSSARSAVLKGLESNGKKPDERLTTLTVDVTNEESVESASKEIKEKFGKDMRLLVNVSGMVRFLLLSGIPPKYWIDLTCMICP